MKQYQVELLAPAGNKEAFIGAINAGADAVYLGGNKYGARAYADNFSTEDLIFCIRYAHLFGKKVYLTVNTLMKEQELTELFDYILPFYEAGLDACIVQDIGAFMYLKRNFPQMELHVSTQMTITGAYGAKMLKALGATRIVPARELSLKEIKTIKEKTGLEIETFIHGAMCYCYSGQCLFSSILGGRSGNRGRCAQPCRLPYSVQVQGKNSKECYPLSLKDMCTIEHIEELMEAGIDSFKIEGRMKKPEYAAGVTAIYRKYIDFKKKQPDKKLQFKQADLEQLSKLYIRSERQDGYYYKQNGADMVTLDSPAYSGSDDALLAQIREKYIDTKRKLPISVYASVVLGEKVSVTFVQDNLSVTVEGSVAEAAQNMPLTAEAIEKQLKKLGDTVFEADSIEVYTDEQCFYSIKSLNELRREAVRRLEDEIIQFHGLPAVRKCLPVDSVQCVNADCYEKSTTPSKKRKHFSYSDAWSVQVSTKEQVYALNQYLQQSDFKPERIYIESELLLQQTDISELKKHSSCYIALPYCMREKDEQNISKLLRIADEQSMKGFLIRSLEEYAYLQEKGYLGEIRTDAGIYIWNREALRFWKDKVTGIQCPIELNKKEWNTLFVGETFEKLVYGRIPMMVTANCVAKTTQGCLHAKESSIACLTDRYKKKFPVSVVCEYCMNIIYNSVPFSIHKEIMDVPSGYIPKIQFTTESKEETIRVLQFFDKVLNGLNGEPPFAEYTTGHEKRGVL